ncbi:MAG TPA: peroxiredoxin [Polyangiaceae bacterium]|nr:peroxiredoxin [Polyangiaceae bacterium]
MNSWFHRVLPRAILASLGPLLTLGVAGCSKKESFSEPPAKSAAPAREKPLAVGDPAPDFEAVAHDGSHVRLRDLRGKAVVLYFYPKDGTPGCTTEAQAFRDEQAAIERAQAVVLGISADDNQSHRHFAEEHGLPFLLLPDTEHSLARAYGVGSFLGMPSRVTYLIDRQGRVARVYPNVDPNHHAAEILRDLSQLPP